MSHVQLLQVAQPIFNANPDGGAYIITSSITVGLTTCHPLSCLFISVCMTDALSSSSSF
jgi:hypothetical protein